MKYVISHHFHGLVLCRMSAFIFDSGSTCSYIVHLFDLALLIFPSSFTSVSLSDRCGCRHKSEKPHGMPLQHLFFSQDMTKKNRRPFSSARLGDKMCFIQYLKTLLSCLKYAREMTDNIFVAIMCL